MKNFSRSVTVLLLAGTLTAGLAQGQVMTHGPVVGGVTPSDAQVFVRTDQVATVRVRYATDPSFGSYLTSDIFTTDSGSDYTKIVPLSGLTAETTYYLDVEVNGAPQLSAPYPYFTTFAPAGAARNFKFVCLSDFTTTRSLTQPTQTFASAAAQNPAFVFIGGDFDHRNPKTLSDKQLMFHDLYDPTTRYFGDFVTYILRRNAIAHQWDDHDSGVNNVDKSYLDWSLTEEAFQEFMPTYPLPPVTPGIWQKFSYAQVDFFILDCRSQRDSENDPDDANKSMLDGNNLGANGQLQWLENGLLASTARWKVIFTSLVTNPTTKFPDGWAGYQTEWNSIKSFINTNQIQGLVFISGDLHLGAIDNGTASGFPEMCLSQANGLGGCPTSGPGVWSEGYYADPTCKGFGVVSVSTNPDQLVLQSLDEFGNVKISYTLSDAAVAPSITVQPADQTVRIRTPATFSVTATGSDPLSYQWHRNGTDIPGATASNYTTPPTKRPDDGSLFSVTVSNSAGSVTSNDATLRIRR